MYHDPQPGLRERKKRNTRQALVDAALDLFERQGFATTTVEQVVAAVDVSRRTFSRYFTAKEDVVVTVEQERYEEVVTALAERPPGEPAMLALRNAILTTVGDQVREDVDRERFQRVQRLLASTPALLAHSLQRQRAVEERVAAVLAERLDARPRDRAATTAGTDLVARLAVSLAHTAARIALDVGQGPSGDLSAEEYTAALRTVFTVMGRDLDFAAAADTTPPPTQTTRGQEASAT